MSSTKETSTTKKPTTTRKKKDTAEHSTPTTRKKSSEQSCHVIIRNCEKYPLIVRSEETLEIDNSFLITEELFEILHWSILQKTNILLIGQSGDGKTELPTYLAKAMNIPITIFDMSTMADPILGLIGAHTIRKTDAGIMESTFVKSRFSKAIQQPGIILLDELSRAEYGATNILFPCLDFRRQLSMEYCFDLDQLPINVHPECIFWATANVGAEYSGTKRIDRALLDRFLPIEVSPLTSHQLNILVARYSISTEQADKIIKTYSEIRENFAEFKISFTLSPRFLKTICEMVQAGFTIYDSFHIMVKGIGGTKATEECSEILSTLNKE